MFSHSYFKQLVKSNFRFLLAFTVVLCTFLVVMSYVFTPEARDGMHNATAGMAVSNIFADTSTLIGFMSNSFYAIMAVIFPMVYSIMVGNRMIAEKVDKGSLAGFLATPTTRMQIILSSAAYLILSLCVMWGVASGVGIIAANKFQPDALDIDTFLMLNLGALLYHLAVSSICFCASCLANTSKASLTFGAGIPLLFFVVSLFIKLSEDLDFLKYVTLNTLFDTHKILTGSGYTGEFLALVAITLVLYGTGIVGFHKKDLPI